MLKGSDFDEIGHKQAGTLHEGLRTLIPTSIAMTFVRRRSFSVRYAQRLKEQFRRFCKIISLAMFARVAQLGFP